MSELIEPSDADLGDTPDSVREYLQALEQQNEVQQALVTHIKSAVSEWCCFKCLESWPHQSVKGLSMQCPNGCGHLLRPSSQALRDAQDRIFDLLLGDDGQASKEAERYLERSRPDLHDRLQLGISNGC